jgi:signal transduction histidine kinase
MAHLLHALNQPLTGLACSLELAVSSPRSPEHHLRTLRESLELTVRMRVLVEAIRELTDVQEADLRADDDEKNEVFPLDALLRETAGDLGPVADAQRVRLCVEAGVSLPVRASRRHLAAAMFRSLESALSLTREGGEFHIRAEREQNQAVLRLGWSAAPPPEHSPFSRPELGLLIAEAGWERAGAAWLHTQAGDAHSCTIRMPLSASHTGFMCVDGES